MRHHHRHHGPGAGRDRHARPVAASAAPLSRAIHNLKSAIDGRLAHGGLERAIVLDVAGLIDQAASRIERL